MPLAIARSLFSVLLGAGFLVAFFCFLFIWLLSGLLERGLYLEALARKDAYRRFHSEAMKDPVVAVWLRGWLGAVAGDYRGEPLDLMRDTMTAEWLEEQTAANLQRAEAYFQGETDRLELYFVMDGPRQGENQRVDAVPLLLTISGAKTAGELRRAARQYRARITQGLRRGRLGSVIVMALAAALMGLFCWRCPKAFLRWLLTVSLITGLSALALLALAYWLLTGWLASLAVGAAGHHLAAAPATVALISDVVEAFTANLLKTLLFPALTPVVAAALIYAGLRMWRPDGRVRGERPAPQADSATGPPVS